MGHHQTPIFGAFTTTEMSVPGSMLNAVAKNVVTHRVGNKKNDQYVVQGPPMQEIVGHLSNVSDLYQEAICFGASNEYWLAVSTERYSFFHAWALRISDLTGISTEFWSFFNFTAAAIQL